MSEQKVMGERGPVNEPEVSGRRRLVRSLMARWANIEKRERWGYGVWGLVALVIAIPEISAAWHMVPWPTISGTVGHLEYRWSWVALIVVALVVSAGFHAVKYPVEPRDDPAPDTDGPNRRTMNGRLTKEKVPSKAAPARRTEVVRLDKLSIRWFLGAIGIVVSTSLLTGLVFDPANPFMLAYILYGLIGLLFVAAPSALAYWRKREVSFPTLFWTLTALERRMHPIAVAVYASLVILLLHLAFYPWPGIFHVLQPQGPPTVVSP
jgi:hypothetical protein